jgi:hypothetical protein
MTSLKGQFLEALHGMKKIRVEFYSKENGRQVVRICAPMDFAPSRRAKDKTNRFHFWDFTSDVGAHTLSLLPNQLQSIEVLEDSFDPLIL